MRSTFAQAELIAVLVAVTDEQPRLMTVQLGDALPSGPFETGHHSLQTGLRAWIENQTGHPVGFLEQLYTFADRDRDLLSGSDNRRISISYLGLVQEQPAPGSGRPEWRGWYEYLPWEDHRESRPPVLDAILEALAQWAETEDEFRDARRLRINHVFGLGEAGWNEDLTLQRYELMYEAGLVAESAQPRHPGFGAAMIGDHRRILATGIARLRAKIKYHPVVFELMPDSFTLLHMQQTVEALAGLRLHKPNFRRQVDQQELIEETGEITSETRGRPAKLFRYRRSILEARALAGSRLPIARG